MDRDQSDLFVLPRSMPSIPHRLAAVERQPNRRRIPSRYPSSEMESGIATRSRRHKPSLDSYREQPSYSPAPRHLLAKSRQQRLYEYSRFNLTFPHFDNSPSGVFQLALVLGISLNIAPEFFCPERSPCLRLRAIFAVGMSVPKTAMNQHDGFPPAKYDIGSARQGSVVEAEA